MHDATHEFEHDERTLLVRETGAAEGLPVFSHHGTPSCGDHFELVAQDARRRGIRLLSIDRPGYGGSTRHQGRTVADGARDTAAAADALGIDRFATYGGSGGGPHALACAALLGERVIACASLAGVAPFDAPGLNWFAGMGSDNWVEFGATLAGAEQLEGLLEEMAAGMAGAGPDDLLEELASLVGPADRAAVDRPLAEYLATATRIALAPGIAGWADDDLAFAAPWGFDLDAIRVPVLVFHGRDDRFVPVAHGEWLGRAIPGAEVRISATEGHLSLVRRTDQVHQWLLEQA